MDNKRRLVFLDIDGTIITEGEKMSPKVSAAIEEAKANGHYLCISSGRPFCDIPKSLNMFDGYISAAGACVMWKQEVLLREYLPEKSFRKIIETLKEVNALYILEGFGSIYASKKNKERLYELYLGSDGDEKRLWEFYYTHTALYNSLEETEKIHKCSFFYSEKNGKWLQEQLKEAGLTVTAFSKSETKGNSGEITQTRYTKGTAVRLLSEYLHVPIEDTVAIGDSDNDLEMLRAAGIGIAMGNASDDIKAKADDVTESVHNDGVYHSFKKYGLIK